MQSYDPAFEPKVADLIGLYVKTPDHAAVFAVDEKTAIQALDSPQYRAAAVAGPGRAPWLRVPTVSAHSRSSPRSLPNSAMCWGRPCRDTRVRLSSSSLATSSSVSRNGERFTSSRTISRPIRPQAVRSFSLEHPHVRLHFTPIYCSRLNSRRSLVFVDRTRPARARHLYCPSPT